MTKIRLFSIYGGRLPLVHLSLFSVLSEASIFLSERDVRQIVGLLSETAALRENHESSKRFLMDGLCRLIAGDNWAWAMFPPTKPGDKVVTAGFLHGGFSADDFPVYLAAMEHPDLAKLNAPFLEMLERKQGHVTRLRQQLDPENRFERMPVFHLWNQANIGPVVLSGYQFPDGCISLIAIYRRKDAELFGEREARICHVLLSEVKWLHAAGWPDLKNADHHLLAPRVRMTLNLLLEGKGRKQIAADLEISENTVSGYVKQIYRFYQVHSQAELLRHFQYGDGGDSD